MLDVGDRRHDPLIAEVLRLVAQFGKRTFRFADLCQRTVRIGLVGTEQEILLRPPDLQHQFLKMGGAHPDLAPEIGEAGGRVHSLAHVEQVGGDHHKADAGDHHTKQNLMSYANFTKHDRSSSWKVRSSWR